MGAQLLKSDDSGSLEGGPFDVEPVEREPPDTDLSRSSPVQESLQESLQSKLRSTPPASALASKLTPPPRPESRPESRAKPGSSRPRFEGDTAAIELRSRLAQARNGVRPPPPRLSFLRALGAFLRFTVLLLTAVAVAGAAGYLAGTFRLFSKQDRLAPSSQESRLQESRLQESRHQESKTPLFTAAAAHRDASGHNSGLIVAPAAAIDMAAAGSRAVAVRPASSAARQPVQAPPSVALTPDASEIATRLKLGADLVAAGDIAAARTMFERVAEAGDATGAFALAETYDPAVLGTLRLRGGLTPDPALARRWYERAKEMGSSAAPERIARLAAY
jgi:hypothetical protein